MLDAGVVDQDVAAAELLIGIGHHGFDLGRLAHVGAVVADADAVGLAGGQHLGARAFMVAKSVEHDVRALACQYQRHAQTYTAG